MPQAWKCQSCGLINFATDADCKRCGAQNLQRGPTGVVLDDGYVLPPPPDGVWRDGATLVMYKTAPLPDYCIKCNRPANGLRIRSKLSWHHPALYILVFGAALFYVIIALALSQRATIDFGICAEHKSRRRMHLNIGLGLLVGGLLMSVLGFAYDYPSAGLIGILLALVAIVWLVIANKIVNVKKIDERYVWLKGVNAEFLQRFPYLPGSP
jgi:hypothetical protein